MNTVTKTHNTNGCIKTSTFSKVKFSIVSPSIQSRTQRIQPCEIFVGIKNKTLCKQDRKFIFFHHFALSYFDPKLPEELVKRIFSYYNNWRSFFIVKLNSLRVNYDLLSPISHYYFLGLILRSNFKINFVIFLIDLTNKSIFDLFCIDPILKERLDIILTIREDEELKQLSYSVFQNQEFFNNINTLHLNINSCVDGLKSTFRNFFLNNPNVFSNLTRCVMGNIDSDAHFKLGSAVNTPAKQTPISLNALNSFITVLNLPIHYSTKIESLNITLIKNIDILELADGIFSTSYSISQIKPNLICHLGNLFPNLTSLTIEKIIAEVTLPTSFNHLTILTITSIESKLICRLPNLTTLNVETICEKSEVKLLDHFLNLTTLSIKTIYKGGIFKILGPCPNLIILAIGNIHENATFSTEKCTNLTNLTIGDAYRNQSIIDGLAVLLSKCDAFTVNGHQIKTAINDCSKSGDYDAATSALLAAMQRLHQTDCPKLDSH